MGNPWPAHMIISVENSATSLLGLLWLREAWGLQPSGDVPPPLENPPQRLGSSEHADAWAEAWSRLWPECLEHTVRGVDPRVFEQLFATPDGSAERANALSMVTGPRWREPFGDAAFETPFDDWSGAWHEKLGETNAVPLAQTPERRVLSALIPAWESGLRKIVTIPCEGDHTRILGSSALLITEYTRRDPERYATALVFFWKNAGT